MLGDVVSTIPNLIWPGAALHADMRESKLTLMWRSGVQRGSEMKGKRSARRARGPHPDTIRLAALKALLALILRDGPRPLRIAGKEIQLAALLAHGEDPALAVCSLDLTADEYIAALWRLTA